MRVWRICRQRRAADALSGDGARRFGGRWNPPGCPVVYTSASLSLAALEVLVHAVRHRIPTDMVAVEIDIPSSVSKGYLRKPPPDWGAAPTPPSTIQRGATWVARGRSAVLRVPSLLVPAEHNYLLNPAHSHARRCRIVSAEPFLFDPRLRPQSS